MTKWKCERCGKDDPCLLQLSVSVTPLYCPFNKTEQEWQEVKEQEPVTDCNQLPTLTAEVFDRPDCPEWAEYAAVTSSGLLFFYEDAPYISKDEYPKRWINYDRFYPVEGSIFDATDWQNSLIERPEKNTLPDWCKVGEWVWRKADFDVKYSKIKTVYDDKIITEEMGSYTLDYILAGNVCPARLRPYNEEELQYQVGQTFKYKGVTMLCLASRDDYLAFVGEHEYQATELLEKGFTSFCGNPCGVLEHLENGEWVK